MIGLLTTFPKRIIVFIVIGFTLLILLIVAMFSTFGSGGNNERGRLQANALPTPAILVPPDVKKTTTRNITFNLGRTTVPSTAFAYKVSYAVDASWAQRLAESFGLTDSPKRSDDADGRTILLWTDSAQQTALSVTLNTGTAEYSVFNIEHIITEKTATASQIVSVAEKFLKDHSLFPPNISANSSTVTYYTDNGGEVEETTDISRANVASVAFTRSLDGIVIYEQYAQTAPIHVWVRKDLSITKATFQYAIIDETSRIPVKLMSLEDAKRSLLQGKGTIVNFTPGVIDPRKELPPQSMVLTKVSMNYFDDKISGVLQPIFVFEGTATYQGLGEEPVVIYLPALSSANKTNE